MRCWSCLVVVKSFGSYGGSEEAHGGGGGGQGIDAEGRPGLSECVLCGAWCYRNCILLNWTRWIESVVTWLAGDR